MKTFHVGFDQAFQNAGWAVLEYEDGKAKYVNSGIFHPSITLGSYSDAVAFVEHQHHAKEILNSVKKLGTIASVCLEGVAFGAPGQASSRGGIWSVYALQGMAFSDVVVVTPTQLKAYITGDGKAEKEAIALEECAKFGIDYDSVTLELRKNKKKPERVFDRTDAIGLAEMGMIAWKAVTFGPTSIKSEVKEHQYTMMCSEKLVRGRGAKPDRLQGICYRLDDMYIKKRG